ncbi:hypothetical protein [Planomonospora parontospora]|uniref:hypothetical protein n=1 Tax=Planomonospora parontospora TaxID=58119 RepID=UPI0016704894|nr:hypothetical protein [Planomonospora parontospora]GGL33676.1 hypothetical protein GCM10014719_38630 [Planomonospora parontospora subsp. antibiotica]GII17144.1 hypothetical protein Ppa05_38700 [Planomonospora parontospora subsp. antibiotica]
MTGGSIGMTFDEEQAALIRYLRRAWPGWTIWRSGGVWYATGSCAVPDCRCGRTLHARGMIRLCERLAEEEQARKGRTAL